MRSVVRRRFAILVCLAIGPIHGQTQGQNQAQSDPGITSKNVIDHLNQTIT